MKRGRKKKEEKRTVINNYYQRCDPSPLEIAIEKKLKELCREKKGEYFEYFSDKIIPILRDLVQNIAGDTENTDWNTAKLLVIDFCRMALSEGFYQQDIILPETIVSNIRNKIITNMIENTNKKGE